MRAEQTDIYEDKDIENISDEFERTSSGLKIKFDGKRNNSEDDKAIEKKKNIFLILCIIFGCLLMILGFVMSIQTMMDYKKSDNLYEQTQGEYVSVNRDIVIVDDSADGSNNDETNEDARFYWYDLIDVNITQLKDKNSDIIGWLWFENEDISYPILHAEDNDKYLHTAYDGSSARAGSIFMDCYNNENFLDSHTIIYGHNMKNGSMFGKLKNYRQEDYYDSHQYFQVITENRSMRYQIFAYEDVSEDSFIYQVPFDKNKEFGDFLHQIQKISMHKTDLNITMEDNVVTLSTCSSTGRRFVVNAVLVDVHEKK